MSKHLGGVSREEAGEWLTVGGSDHSGGFLAVYDASSLQVIHIVAFSSPVAAFAYLPSGAGPLITIVVYGLICPLAGKCKSAAKWSFAV